jgi:hypothetical protein
MITTVDKELIPTQVPFTQSALERRAAPAHSTAEDSCIMIITIADNSEIYTAAMLLLSQSVHQHIAGRLCCTAQAYYCHCLAQESVRALSLEDAVELLVGCTGQTVYQWEPDLRVLLYCINSVNNNTSMRMYRPYVSILTSRLDSMCVKSIAITNTCSSVLSVLY